MGSFQCFLRSSSGNQDFYLRRASRFRNGKLSFPKWIFGDNGEQVTAYFNLLLPGLFVFYLSG